MEEEEEEEVRKVKSRIERFKEEIGNGFQRLARNYEVWA